MPTTENPESSQTPKTEEVKDNIETSKNGTESVKDKNTEETSEENNESDERTDKEKLIGEATTLLAQGKRHLFVKDYPSAVAALGEACSKFSEVYGELADECADSYFNYGCGLLELSREESGVLEVDNKEKESEESEADDGNEEGEDKKTGKENENEAETEKNNDNDNKTEEEGGGEEKDDEKPTEENKDAEGEDNEEEEDEDVNNLQLAWEMFELAKVIFQRQKDDMKLAETYLRLGEVALESENYESAILDIQNCLDLQKKILPPASREIAETFFQLGVACSLCNQFDEAIKHFTAAGVLLEKRIQNLRKMSEPEPEKAKNPFYSIDNEIEEIKALLPEIKDKIADMEEFKNETMKAVVQATIGSTVRPPTTDKAGSSTNGTSSSSTPATAPTSSGSSKAPANDISHLIRKKRKSTEEIGNESKKLHKETDST